MYLIARTEITVQQMVTTEQFPSRGETFTFRFANEFEIESSWANLTTTGKLKFPKNMIVIDKNGVKRNLGSYVGGRNNKIPIIAPLDAQSPLFLRGDKISIRSGYEYIDGKGQTRTTLNDLPGKWITSVTNKLPVEIEFQDNMYLLKQTQATNKVYASTVSMETIIKELLGIVNKTHSVNLTLAPNPSNTSTHVGNFKIQNETVCQVLERLQKDYKIESWFRGDVLHSGLIVYQPPYKAPISIVFQRNVIKDEMNYQRTDDVNLIIHAYSVSKEELKSVTKIGRVKTTKKRLETYVGVINKQYVEVGKEKIKDAQVRTMFFWAEPNQPELTQKSLVQKAKDALKKFYFEGYRGKFETFMLPFIQHGDQVLLTDNRLPERTGTYFIKTVTYKGGLNGMRQIGEIDFRTDIFSQTELNGGV